MDDVAETLAAARDAYQRHDWAAARAGFLAARAAGELDAADLDTLGDAAWWLGEVDEASAALEAACRRHLEAGRPGPAAMAAIGVAVNALLRGDEVVGAGWLGRAQRLLQDQPEGPAHGYLLYLELEGALGGGDTAGVTGRARRLREVGRRHEDPNLTAAGDLFEGRALVKAGRVADGMALLDEAMLAVRSGELGPAWAGNLYCHLMTAFTELADVRRAAEWTDATSRWLATLPTAVLFTGICRVHRSQVLQRRGDWAQAEREADLVCADLADLQLAGAAEGHNQVGEIRRPPAGRSRPSSSRHRPRPRPRPPTGRPTGSAATPSPAWPCYASPRAGRRRPRPRSGPPWPPWSTTGSPGPGCAPPRSRSRWPPAIPQAPGGACDELERTASTYGSSGLAAAALQARGTVLLAGDRAEAALPTLRAACRRWQELAMPHDAARVRLLLARAYRALGDEDAATMELDAAEPVFDRLGAAPDAAAARALRGRPALPGGLTGREAQVLALVAAGRTNREIADTLVLSHKTVARHLSNIFAKLGVRSRTQAAAYAYEHGLAAPDG